MTGSNRKKVAHENQLDRNLSQEKQKTRRLQKTEKSLSLHENGGERCAPMPAKSEKPKVSKWGRCRNPCCTKRALRVCETRKGPILVCPKSSEKDNPCLWRQTIDTPELYEMLPDKIKILGMKEFHMCLISSRVIIVYDNVSRCLRSQMKCKNCE